ncbi:MAG: CarD family transcriptional regulator [Eubacteriaceae bacterium]
MFRIGDKIVYPMHGAGIIEDIQEKEILGEIQSYYILKLPIGDMKVMIPINNSEELGLRDIVDNETLTSVIKQFNIVSEDMQSNWNRRYRKNMEKIKTGDIYEVAEVVSSLHQLDITKGLSTGEKKMLNNAKQILISEFVLVKDISNEDAEQLIFGNIK